jgi:hypothetical protein
MNISDSPNDALDVNLKFPGTKNLCSVKFKQ